MYYRAQGILKGAQHPRAESQNPWIVLLINKTLANWSFTNAKLKC